MGFTTDQLETYHAKLTSNTDKLQVMFDDAVKEVGEVRAAELLLDACGSIECPTIGVVMDQLEKAGCVFT